MKLRKGFVSNSSSSSFICDTKMPLEEVEKTLREFVEFYNKHLQTEYSSPIDYERHLILRFMTQMEHGIRK